MLERQVDFYILYHDRTWDREIVMLHGLDAQLATPAAIELARAALQSNLMRTRSPNGRPRIEGLEPTFPLHTIHPAEERDDPEEPEAPKAPGFRARTIVSAVLAELGDLRGIGNEIEQLDDDVRTELITTLTNMVQVKLDET